MRNIFTVFATQVVTSAQNPQGVLSNLPNYPKTFDSRSYKQTEQNPNGDEEIALLAARADYDAEIVSLATADNATRVAWAVYVIRASDGKQIYRSAWGNFPDMTPVPPEPTPEPETTPEPEEPKE